MLTSLREKLIKIGAKVVGHGHYITFQMAEVAISHKLCAAIMRAYPGFASCQTGGAAHRDHRKLPDSFGGGWERTALWGIPDQTMFHTMRTPVIERMRYLEQIDAKDREDGTPRLQRLRQIPPNTGKFLALLAAGAPAGSFLEVGTSAGYSTLWLAVACEASGRTITTFEILPEKAAFARETIAGTQMENTIRLVEGDALVHLDEYEEIGFCFLDAEKDVYEECYEKIIPKLVRGGLLVADNAINHEAALRPMLHRALADARVDALILPIGKGELVCRKI